MYIVKLITVDGEEELLPECRRIFKKPLEPGKWLVRLSPGDRIFTVPSSEIDTAIIMTKHGDTVEILGKKPQWAAKTSHQQRRRRTG